MSNEQAAPERAKANPSAAQIHSMRLAGQASTIGRVMAAMVAGLSEEEQTERLAPAVQFGLIEPETADAIVAGEIAPRASAAPFIDRTDAPVTEWPFANTTTPPPDPQP